MLAGEGPPQDSLPRSAGRNGSSFGRRERGPHPYSENAQRQARWQDAERPSRSELQGSPDFAERAPMADRFNGAANSGPSRSPPLPSSNVSGWSQKEASVDRSRRQNNGGHLANEGASEAWQERNNDGAAYPQRESGRWQRDGQGRGHSQRGSGYTNFPLSRQVDPRQAARYPSSISGPPPQYYQPREGDPLLKAIREEWQGEALYGVNSVLAAFAAKRRDVYALYYQEGAILLSFPKISQSIPKFSRVSSRCLLSILFHQVCLDAGLLI